MDELTEKEEHFVETEPEEWSFIRRAGLQTDLDKQCYKCGSERLMARERSIRLSNTFCTDCGAIQSNERYEQTAAEQYGTELVEDSEENRGGADSGRGAGGGRGAERGAEREAGEATENFGKMLQMVGLLFCLTIVGAVIGIPLLVIGARMEVKNSDS